VEGIKDTNKLISNLSFISSKKFSGTIVERLNTIICVCHTNTLSVHPSSTNFQIQSSLFFLPHSMSISKYPAYGHLQTHIDTIYAMFFADIFYISTPNKYSSHKNATSFIHYSYKTPFLRHLSSNSYVRASLRNCPNR